MKLQHCVIPRRLRWNGEKKTLDAVVTQAFRKAHEDNRDPHVIAPRQRMFNNYKYSSFGKKKYQCDFRSSLNVT